MKSFLLALAVAAASTSAVVADEIRLVGGDVLKGTVVSESEKSVVLDHAALGRVEIARDRVAAVVKAAAAAKPAEAPPSAPPAEPKAPAVAEPAPPVALLPAPTPPPPAKPDGSWKFSLSLGFTGSKNETQSSWDLRAAATANRQSEADRTTLLAEYYFRTNDGTNTDNNFLFKATEDFLFKDSKWEAFVQGTYQNDEFQEWEQRIGFYAGPAYRLFEGEPLSLRLRAGAGANYEFADSTWTPELLFGDELVWKIDQRSSLKQGLDFFPDIDNFGEYRFVLRLDYEIALSPKGDLKATAGIRDEYDSYVEPSRTSTNDMKIYAGIKVDF